MTRLTKTEAKLLMLLSAADGGIVDQEEIFEVFGWWGPGDRYTRRLRAANTLRVHVGRLRRKGVLIATEHARGYRLARAEVAA